MGANRLLGILGSVIIIVGLFLPAVSMLGMNVSMWASEGADRFIYLGMGVIGAILAFTGRTRLLIGTGLITLALTILNFTKGSDAASAAGISMFDLIGIGFWALAIGGLLQLVGGLMRPAGDASPAATSPQM